MFLVMIFGKNILESEILFSWKSGESRGSVKMFTAYMCMLRALTQWVESK